RLSRGIEWQKRLQPHQAIDDENAADMEQQHRDRVGQPMLLASFIDATDAIERDLDRLQHRRQKRALAVEDTRHVPAERLHQQKDDDAIENDLEPANDGHGNEPWKVARNRM